LISIKFLTIALPPERFHSIEIANRCGSAPPHGGAVGLDNAARFLQSTATDGCNYLTSREGSLIMSAQGPSISNSGVSQISTALTTLLADM
jgi:hypothetical protein